MKKFVSIVFGSLQPSYLIKQYIFCAIFYSIMLYAGIASTGIRMMAFLTINLVAYPFAMFVYDSIIDVLLGDRVLISNIVLVVVWGIIKVMIIFAFSILIAPFGILYLYFTNRHRYQ